MGWSRIGRRYGIFEEGSDVGGLEEITTVRVGDDIDLNAAVPPNLSLQLVEPFNINDRGEIVGRGLPAGCDNGDACGHKDILFSPRLRLHKKIQYSVYGGGTYD
jgi:hypothetical protein